MNRKRYRSHCRGVIYKATNILTEKVYIGKTCATVNRRAKGHWRDAKTKQRTKFHKALIEFGFDSFRWEIVDVFLTRKESRIKERIWINKHNSITEGYNSI